LVGWNVVWSGGWIGCGGMLELGNVIWCGMRFGWVVGLVESGCVCLHVPIDRCCQYSV
jgi:hypothetical protein